MGTNWLFSPQFKVWLRVKMMTFTNLSLKCGAPFSSISTFLHIFIDKLYIMENPKFCMHLLNGQCDWASATPLLMILKISFIYIHKNKWIQWSQLNIPNLSLCFFEIFLHGLDVFKVTTTSCTLPRLTTLVITTFFKKSDGFPRYFYSYWTIPESVPRIKFHLYQKLSTVATPFVHVLHKQKRDPVVVISGSRIVTRPNSRFYATTRNWVF